MRVCVYGASSTTLDRIYIEEGEKLGKALALRGHSLVFGGGKNGMMGAAAKGVKAGGGHITGVAPPFFKDAGTIYDECDDFVYTETMHERKKYMEDHSDAFIVTPGGIGTYEEFIEVLTLKQLARLSKPIVLFNINGFFDKLHELFTDNVKTGFIRAQTLELYKIAATVDEVINIIETDSYDISKIRFTD